ncbi:S-adenosyl-L-methionine-dependent methyltransferase [Aspergillus coremiiformis]|uniref:tRNA (guanine(26)-N(2))-dimethyltransferase n=1 Tax=Aspergillus coremiiformis TaxID=138285 RepID=A0A5N6Z4V7_9EURO|nr:S-adenosyl-L-methionine-dependent methyltransferase [Aspergillus coremiiformis]
MAVEGNISQKPNDIDTHSIISMQELDPSPVQDEFPDLECGEYIPKAQGPPSHRSNRSEGRLSTLTLGLRGLNWGSWSTRSVPESETYLLLTRPIYQSPGLEHVVLTVPILIHIVSGITLRNVRSYRRARLYGAETRSQRYLLNFWPRTSVQARLGYSFVPLLGIHALVNRVMPSIVDGGSSGVGLGYVAHGIARNPTFWHIYYAVFVAVGMWHIVGGWAAWMGWRITTARRERCNKKGSLDGKPIKYLLAPYRIATPSLVFHSVRTNVLSLSHREYFHGCRVSLRYCSLQSSTMEMEPSRRVSDQLVQYEGKEYHVVKEGNAFILNPPSQAAASKGTRRNLKADDEVQSVFYNPIQQFNRDLSVLAIKAFGEHVLASQKQRTERRQGKGAMGGKAKGKKRKREDGDEEEPNGKGSNPDGQAQNGDQPVSGSHLEPSTTPSFTILDALSATGLRALRYASEIPFATCIVANDLSPSAIQSMKLNIEYNGLGKLIHPNTGDARTFMYSALNSASNQGSGQYAGKFDVIDLDPYGSAAQFMDSAVQAVKGGGLLCVTCTDAGVWASNGYPEKSFALYGGVPTKGTHSHEGGLRLILHAIAASASKYGLAIEPLLSLSIDFYARVFFASGNTMVVYNCDAGCGAWSTQPLTQTKPRLDKKGNPFYHYGFAQGPVANTTCGPMWAGPLHNPHFIQKILDMLPAADRSIYQTIDRLEGMLTTALEEDLSLSGPSRSGSPEPTISETKGEDPAIIPRTDPALREPYPFYFSLSALSKVLHTSTIPADAFRGAVRHLGYQCTRSHTKPNTIRTDAPWDLIWEIMREWVRQKSPIKENSLKPGTAGAAIMTKSRGNAQQPREADQQLDLLKKEIVSAAENGKDISDVVTKVEAALYRSSFRQALQQDSQTISPAGHGTSTTKSHPSTLDVVFDESLGREVTKKRLVRYQLNPRPNWGPLNRASGREQE